MVSHRIVRRYYAVFEDGSRYSLVPENEPVYFFHEQQHSYLIAWLECVMKENNIQSKPVRIEEVMEVAECEPYDIIIGV